MKGYGEKMTDFEEMTNESSFKFVENFINEKIKENPQIIIYTFYELKVKLNMSDNGVERFLKCSKIILEDLGYQLFYTGHVYQIGNEERIVQSNELMIAVKYN